MNVNVAAWLNETADAMEAAGVEHYTPNRWVVTADSVGVYRITLINMIRGKVYYDLSDDGTKACMLGWMIATGMRSGVSSEFRDYYDVSRALDVDDRVWFHDGWAWLIEESDDTLYHVLDDKKPFESSITFLRCLASRHETLGTTV